MGRSLGALAFPVGWHQIFIKSNVHETSSAPAVPGYPSVFLKAWHLK